MKVKVGRLWVTNQINGLSSKMEADCARIMHHKLLLLCRHGERNRTTPTEEPLCVASPGTQTTPIFGAIGISAPRWRLRSTGQEQSTRTDGILLKFSNKVMWEGREVLRLLGGLAGSSPGTIVCINSTNFTIDEYRSKRGPKKFCAEFMASWSEGGCATVRDEGKRIVMGGARWEHWPSLDLPGSDISTHSFAIVDVQVCAVTK